MADGNDAFVGEEVPVDRIEVVLEGNGLDGDHHVFLEQKSRDGAKYVDDIDPRKSREVAQNDLGFSVVEILGREPEGRIDENVRRNPNGFALTSSESLKVRGPRHWPEVSFGSSWKSAGPVEGRAEIPGSAREPGDGALRQLQGLVHFFWNDSRKNLRAWRGVRNSSADTNGFIALTAPPRSSLG